MSARSRYVSRCSRSMLLTSASMGESARNDRSDEFDRSFLALSPMLALVNNIDLEHLDTYRDLADIQATCAPEARRRLLDVRAGHFQTHAFQELGETAHADAPDADEVEALHAKKVHAASTSKRRSHRREAASGAAEWRAASPIARSRN